MPTIVRVWAPDPVVVGKLNDPKMVEVTAGSPWFGDSGKMNVEFVEYKKKSSNNSNTIVPSVHVYKDTLEVTDTANMKFGVVADSSATPGTYKVKVIRKEDSGNIHAISEPEVGLVIVSGD
ncbi:hypothetical protein SAZ10_25315 [Mesorhizobium sp. BAC0120]|uniref:hypothetical protein n=1 Tax=Mesorhizobium sp. BAC0120 TaxID=3090670 RepID=UPI00298BE407|nr:hypothetical protein [Mesorhizobium sp. BAC0120]MDW6025082.1 hypothetical protein [Mesorhizobium sp. BAC0120]